MSVCVRARVCVCVQSSGSTFRLLSPDLLFPSHSIPPSTPHTQAPIPFPMSSTLQLYLQEPPQGHQRAHGLAGGSSPS